MNTPKLSVILPVYNVSEYLEKCLDSIINQSLKEIEIIIINDCSPDPFDDIICQEYANKDDRIVYVKHEKNLGLGGARNTGIKLSKADYIGFVDSDDFIDLDLYKTVYDEAVKDDNDIVVFGYDLVNKSHEILEKRIPLGHTEGDLFGNFIKSKNSMNPASWNKLWKKSLYVDNNIEFPLHTYYQDLATTSRVLYFAKNIKFLDKVLYHYLIRDKSITLTYSIKHIDDLFVVLSVLTDFLNKIGALDKYNNALQKRFHHMVSYHLNNGVKKAPGNIKKRILPYLREKIFSSNLVDTEYYLSQVNYIESHLIFNGIHPFLEKIDDLSILVKTFLRPDNLNTFLESVGEYQNRNNIQFHEVIIGDDSSNEFVAKNKKIISKINNKYPFININHQVYPYNIGLSEGRNKMLDICQSSHFLLCDDDFILDSNSSLIDVLNLAKDRDTDILGGWLKNNYINEHNYTYWGTIGKFKKADSKLYVNLNENEDYHPYYEESDFLLNFFIGKTNVIKTLRWDQELKTEEHYDFFYRAYHDHLCIAFTNTLFAKHPPSRKTNSPLYNSFRYDKDVWEHYLYLSIAKLGVEERVISRWRKKSFIRWTTNHITHTNTNINYGLHKPIFNQLVNVKQISPNFEHHFFGYFDILAMDSKEEKHLAIRINQMHELPDKNTKVDICVIDTANNNLLTVIDSTYAWCFQQGCFLQFIPGNDNEVIYNIFDEQENTFKAVIYNLVENKKTLLPLPVANISPDGKKALSINFSRLYDYRPGYGYNNIEDPFRGMVAPEKDGIFLLDLETKEYKLILSYRRLWEKFVKSNLHENVNEKLLVNHVNFNTDGSRFILLLRFFSDTPPFPTLTITADTNGDNLCQIFGFTSHYHWKDSVNIAITGDNVFNRKDLKNITLLELADKTGVYSEIDSNYFIGDGHCSYSPDRKYMLYDSYSSTQFPYRKLQLYDLDKKKGVTLGYFFSDPSLYGNNVDCRCDLHPRWSPNGTYITFDSIHKGFRGIYQIKAEEAIREIGKDIEGITEDEIKKLLKTRRKKAIPQRKKNSAIKRIKKDRWYKFGQLPTEDKIKTIIRVSSKKTHTYWFAKLVYKPIKYFKLKMFDKN